MISALLYGLGVGTGLWALSVWLVPPRPPLGEVLARATTSPPPAPILTTGGSGWAVRLGRPFVGALLALGLPGQRIRRDLVVTGRTISTHLAEKAVLGITGFLAPALLHLLLLLGGISPGVQLPVLLGVIAGTLGFVLPDLRICAEANKLRVSFRHALSAHLDLVWITLAGGSGVDSALNDTVTVGRGWAFTQIRRALAAARLTRTTPWTTLRQLGDELEITELSDLASTVSLAGTEGAKIRQSLAAKANALRTRQLTEAEAESQAATERMSLPVMVLFVGFLLFIGYPALSQVLNGL